MNICTPKKRDEKLNYLPSNPLQQDLLKHPGDPASHKPLLMNVEDEFEVDLRDI